MKSCHLIQTTEMMMKRKGGGKHVCTLSNQTSGNAVLDYKRAVNGTLIFNTAYPTGGSGTGGG